MLTDVLVLALSVGVCNWGFRYLPLRIGLHNLAAGGPVGRFLAATGPAAIATLFVAEVLPYASNPSGQVLPPLAGAAAVLAIFAWRKSVVLATLAGSVAFGLAFAMATG